jgi:hypothetical protein
MPCAICLHDSELHAGGLPLECRHSFGAPCIARWCCSQVVRARAPTCPVCLTRLSLVDAVRITAGKAVGADELHCFVVEEDA